MGIVTVVSAALSQNGKVNGGGIAGVIVLFFAAALGALSQCVVRSAYDGAVRSAENAVIRYVKNTLNAEWQSSRGIRWNIEKKTSVITSGSGEDRSTTTYIRHHIGITCVQSAKEAAHQAAAVVVVPA